MQDFQKQNVQWFPGHMAKTKQEIKNNLKLVDGVVEIVDARLPRSSSNVEILDIIGNKPHIVILNKCDMADQSATELWLDFYNKNGIFAFAADCRSGKGLNQFTSVCTKALSKVIKRNESRGMKNKTLRLMVVGIPNTGKSSFINKIAKKSKAQVGNLAGVTKQNQWITVNDDIELLDTPGVLLPKYEDTEVGDRLAFIGSVKADIIDSETLACRLLKILKNTYPEMISSRYKIDIESIENLDEYDLMLMIGKKRGFLSRGGEIDSKRCADTLCDEFKGGKLGKITLEMP